MEINIDKWKEFELGKLFEIRPTKHHKLTNAMLFNASGKTPVVVNSSFNNGIGGFTTLYATEKAPKITFSDTTDADAIFLQTEDFAGYSHIQCLNPIEYIDKWNKKTLMFLQTVFKVKARTMNYNYANKFTRDSASKLMILLPAIYSQEKEDYEPNWDYMEEYIKEIEEKYIEKVNKYNQENIQKALNLVGITEDELNKELFVKPANRYEEFKVGDLFDVNKIKGINNDSLNNNYNQGEYRYITRTSLNNGISSITGKIKNIEMQDANTFSLGLLGMDFFFQPEPWYAGQFIRNISPKFKINSPLALYFGALLNKRTQLYKTVLIRDFDRTFKNDTLSLPAIDENTPDFDYMEKTIYMYIKKVIKSWQMDNEKEIKALKSFVNKD